MTQLTWIPEAYPPSGTIGAAGFSKLLGRPHLDPLTVLVRETAQNSWDARDDSGMPVRFSIDGRVLDDDVLRTLRDSVFTSVHKSRARALSDSLKSERLSGLYISDRHTIGLGGPVLASIADPEDVYDWVDFVLNVGKANNQGFTGGTYGFGKTIAYVVSQAKTIVIHSRARHKGTSVTRLMACAVGDEFRQGNRLFTGRHWWGVPRDDASVPLEGKAAEALANDLGMPPFLPGEYGTNILILAPNFGGRTEIEGMTFISEAVVWNLWPKLLPRPKRPQMEITVSWAGQQIRIPTLDERPPLGGFAQALRILDGEDLAATTPGHELLTIRSERPRTVMGDLALVPMVAQNRAIVEDGNRLDDPDSPAPARLITESRSHHVALLRTPELVIEYLPGPLLAEPHLEWAGVFRVRDEHDATFAKAEPPTHDSWRPELLEEKVGRSLVKRALQQIADAADQRWGNSRLARPAEVESTAVVARHLAHLVGASSGGAVSRVAGGPRVIARNVARIRSTGAGPVRVGGGIATRATFLVIPAAGTLQTLVDVSVGVALDDNGSDTSLDPQLDLIEGTIGDTTFELTGKSTSLVVSGAQPTELRLTAARSPDTSVMFDVRVAAVADGRAER